MKLISCLLFLLFIEMHNAEEGSPPKVIKISLTTTEKKMHSANGRSIVVEDLSKTVGQIKIGSPPQDFMVLFDTGSPYVWVYSSKYDTCDKNWNILFRKQKVYNRESSSTYREINTRHDNPKALFIEYGSEWVFGFWAKDKILLDGNTIRRKFLEVTKTTEMGLQREINGIVGLWYDPIEGNIVTALCDKLQAEHKFSYYLPKVFRQKYNRKGELILCGQNESRYIASTMKYVKEAYPGNWIIRLDSVALEEATGEQPLTSRPLALVDTGTNGIVGPAAIMKTVFDILKPYVLDSTIYQEVDCQFLDKFPNITFTIDGTKFFLTPQEYIMEIQYSCFALFSPHENNFWVLGEPFLRKYYTVFDMDNHAIGIAESKG